MSTYRYDGPVTATLSDVPTVLIPGQTVTADSELSYAERLIARVHLSTDCSPTELSWVPGWLPPVGKTAVLAWNNMPNTGGMDDAIYGPLPDGLYLSRASRANVALNAGVAEADVTAAHFVEFFFLYSGLDLRRQFGMQDHFDFTPSLNLQPGDTLQITGIDRDASPASDFTLLPEPFTLQLIPVPSQYLGANEVDFVMGTWGHAVSVHSCAQLINTGE